MADTNERPSLATDLETRYKQQRVGSAFDVKERLGGPGSSPQAGDSMPIGGNEVLHTKGGFTVKAMQGVTDFKDAQEANVSNSPKSKQTSRFLKGFNNKKYKG